MDLVFMINKDLKLQLGHYNRTERRLEVISTFQIDMQIMGGASGRQLKEIVYIKYDKLTQTVVAVFA
jgi:hypothetical protein